MIDRLDKDCWETPDYIFNNLNKIFKFTQDVCANCDNYKIYNYLSAKENSLCKSWDLSCWCNPPYSKGNIDKFMEKAYNESLLGKTIVCLIPPATSTKWFNKYALKGEIYIRNERIKFIHPITKLPGKSPRGDNMLVVYNSEKTEELKNIGWMKINGKVY